MKRVNAKNNAYKPGEIKVNKTKGRQRVVKFDKFLSPIVNTNEIAKHPVKDVGSLGVDNDKTVTAIGKDKTVTFNITVK